MQTKEKIKDILNFFKQKNNISLPYAVKIKSKNKGKNIFIACSTHGNETVGSTLAYEFLNKYFSKEIELESGSITFLLSNYKAFEKNVRYINKDLNRSFLKNIENNDPTWESTRAKEIMNNIQDKEYDLMMDFHSVSIGDFKIIVTNKTHDSSVEEIKNNSIIENIFLFDEKHINGTLISHFNQKNIPAFLIECGNHTSDNASNIAKLQFYNVLNKLDILKNDYNKNKINNFKFFESISKIKTGKNFKWIVENPSTYKKVRQNQEICFDENNKIQKAPKDCLLFMPSKTVKHTDTDAGFLVEEKKY